MKRKSEDISGITLLHSKKKQMAEWLLFDPNVFLPMVANLQALEVEGILNPPSNT